MAPRVKFDRHELAGSFGDIGTDLPLLVAMIPAARLDPAAVFTLFGLAQILSGLFYGLPMPMQPLKAMAVIVITQGVSGRVLAGGGLAVGALMLLLAATGLLTWLSRVLPHPVVRGVQLGLGLSLAQLALTRYVPGDYALAAGAFLLVVLLRESRRLPAALPVVALGAVYALLFSLDPARILAGAGLVLPALNPPGPEDVLTGLWVLALPQLPLSLGNAVVATERTVRDLFPDRPVTARRLGLTYGVVNVFQGLFGGVPVCHGCGGLAGHYAFGARTGGAVLLYGAFYLVVGLFLSGAAAAVVAVFPRPVLGVILLFEALTLMSFVRDVAGDRRSLGLALLVGTLAMALPQGYLVGVLAGTALYYGRRSVLGGG